MVSRNTRLMHVLGWFGYLIALLRSSSLVVASEKGIVVGCISFKDDGDFIDCQKMGVGGMWKEAHPRLLRGSCSILILPLFFAFDATSGKAIPPSIDRITDIQGTAKFVLLVEKDAAFMRLAEDRFYQKYPCVIITAKGQPDVATRLFLKKVKVSATERMPSAARVLRSCLTRLLFPRLLFAFTRKRLRFLFLVWLMRIHTV